MKDLLFFLAFRGYRLLSSVLFPLVSVSFRNRLVTLLYRLGRRLFPDRIRYDADPFRTINLRIPKARTRPLPEWALAEMRNLSEYEPLLYPDIRWMAATACCDTPDYSIPGHAYAQLGKHVRQAYRHIILTPWLKSGGADLGVIYWAEALAACSPEKEVLVVATEVAESPWKTKLPPTADFLDFGSLTKDLSLHERATVLARLLVQHPPETLHIINSNVGWQAIELFGSAIRSKSRIYASVFCDDYSIDGVPRGYGRTALPAAWQHLSRAFSDNTAYPKRLQRSLGLPPSLFRTIYFPAKQYEAAKLYAATNRVLWASRLDRQKRPDILYAIASAMPELEFHVYGEPLLDDGRKWQRKLKQLANVRLFGGFDGFQSIPPAGYFAFLYTSAWDGLPLVLMQATAAGLPIVTAPVGGIGDLITVQSGFLVGDADDWTGYVEALRQLHGNPGEGQARWQHAMAIIQTRHAASQFSQAVAENLLNS